jgi:hypothetical protein
MATLQVSSGNYESYAHKLLWESACRHLTLAESNLQDSWFLHLSAGLLAAAAFEAYLNYIGEEILPDVWAEERSFFAQSNYKGTFGKLKRIAEEVDWQLPRRDRLPLSSVVELTALRHKMVHARTHKVNWKHTHRADQLPAFPPGWLSAEAKPATIRRLINRTEEFAVLLHSQIQSSDLRYCVIGSHPLVGMLGFGSYSARATHRER